MRLLPPHGLIPPGGERWLCLRKMASAAWGNDSAQGYLWLTLQLSPQSRQPQTLFTGLYEALPSLQDEWLPMQFCVLALEESACISKMSLLGGQKCTAFHSWLDIVWAPFLVPVL